MGRVYLGRSPGGRAVAVKVMRPELSGHSDFRYRFTREVEAARRVSGAFTAAVVDADPDGFPPWLATAYLAAPALDEVVCQHGPMAVAEVLALAAGVTEALAAVHEAGLVHRDLKPANVLLAADGPRVIDFGIATPVAPVVPTRHGPVLGSPDFMSPEQITSRAVGTPSDVFSLGALITYAATGHGPFGAGPFGAGPFAADPGTPHRPPGPAGSAGGDTAMPARRASSAMFRIVYEPPELGALPRWLREPVRRCLDKDPQRRPTAAQLLAEFSVLLHDARRLTGDLAVRDRPSSDAVACDSRAREARSASPVGRVPRAQPPSGSGDHAGRGWRDPARTLLLPPTSGDLLRESPWPLPGLLGDADTVELPLRAAGPMADTGPLPATSRTPSSHAAAQPPGASTPAASVVEQTHLHSAQLLSRARVQAEELLDEARRAASAIRAEAEAVLEAGRGAAERVQLQAQASLAMRRQRVQEELVQARARADAAAREQEERADRMRVQARNMRERATREARAHTDAARQEAERIIAAAHREAERVRAGAGEQPTADGEGPVGIPPGAADPGDVLGERLAELRRMLHPEP